MITLKYTLGTILFHQLLQNQLKKNRIRCAITLSKSRYLVIILSTFSSIFPPRICITLRQYFCCRRVNKSIFAKLFFTSFFIDINKIIHNSSSYHPGCSCTAPCVNNNVNADITVIPVADAYAFTVSQSVIL